MLRRVNGPLASRLQRRGQRRLLVLATLVNAGIVGVAMCSVGDRPALMGLAAVPYFVSMWLLNLALRGIFELSDERLDEHQIAVRNHGYKAAYGLTLVFLVVVVTASSVASLDRIGTFAVAATAFLVSALAPRMITAWILEDVDDQD